MPYRGLKQEELILRDLLARDRTVLANERTLLSYTRTALMLSGSGVSLYKLVPEGGTATVVSSALLVMLGAAAMAWGAKSYLRVRRQLAGLAPDRDDDLPPLSGGQP